MSYQPKNPNGQATMANSTPVVIASNQTAIPVVQATAANLNATVTGTVELGANSLAALENISVTVPGTVDLGTVSLTALETITVDQNVASNLLNKPYGAVTSSAPTYINDMDAPLSLTTAGSLRTVLTTELPAGTNAIGKLAANDGVDIGDVTINNASIAVTGTFWQAIQPVSITNDVAINLSKVSGTNIVNGGTAGTLAIGGVQDHDAAIANNKPVLFGGFASSTAPTAVANGDLARLWTTTSGALNIADGGSSISIDDGGNTITVDGTVSVNALPAGTNNIGDVDVASLPGTVASDITAIKTAVETLDNAVSGNELQVDIVAALPAGTNAIGKLAANDGVDIGDVTINNASIAVTGTFWQATQPVSLASVPSHPVTNAGTFAVQAAQSGTWTVQPGNTANTTPWLFRGAEYVGTATALGALNAEVAQALNGTVGAAVTITAQSSPGGIVLTPYVSYNNGANWTVTQFFNSANGDAISTLSAFTTGAAYSISAGDGATHIKVVATSWTSGSVTVQLSATNSQGIVNLKSTAVHDEAAGSFLIQTGAVASATAPTAVGAGDAVRLWATTSGALNIADGGSTISIDDGAGSITVDGTVAATQSGTWNINTITTANLAADDVHDSAAGTTLVMAGGYAYGVAVADNAPPAVSANADAARLLTNKNGAMVVVHMPEPTQAYAPTNATTTGYASSLTVKASAGTLYRVIGYNSRTTAQFIQIHDAASLPGDTAVPKVIFLVPGSSNFEFDLGNYGRYFGTGIVVCNSSTGPTKTIGSPDCWFDVQYK